VPNRIRIVMLCMWNIFIAVCTNHSLYWQFQRCTWQSFRGNILRCLRKQTG